METFSPSLVVGAYDGRYHDKTKELMPIASVYALTRNRLLISALHFNNLMKELGHSDKIDLESWNKNIIEPLQISIKENVINETVSVMIDKCLEIEKTTNHDVTSVVRFLKSKYEELNLGSPMFNGYIHLGLTSEDINTTSYMLMIRTFNKIIFNNNYDNIVKQLEIIKDNITDSTIDKSKSDYMLSLTHGQPATPTRMSHVLNTYMSRLKDIQSIICNIPDKTKFGGATGGMNALGCLDVEINLQKYCDEFASQFRMQREKYTSQVGSYDIMIAKLQLISNFNQILLDMCQDIWHYISRGIFILKKVEGEDGSSAMPNKINPIQFENATGNIRIANGLIQTMALNLQVSIMQRDLCNSTIMRQLGNVFASCLVAWKNICSGLQRLDIDYIKLQQEIDDNIVVVTEGLQTVLRFCGHPNGYDDLKKITRGKQVTKELLLEFVNGVQLDAEYVNIAYKGKKSIDDIKTMMKLIVTKPDVYFNTMF